MSRSKKRKLVWDAPAADTVGWHVYAQSAAIPEDSEMFALEVDAGDLNPVAFVTVQTGPFWEITGLPDGDYDFAVVADDGNGNLSDPLVPDVWLDVPLDLTPPPTPTGGAIVFYE